MNVKRTGHIELSIFDDEQNRRLEWESAVPGEINVWRSTDGEAYTGELDVILSVDALRQLLAAIDAEEFAQDQHRMARMNKPPRR